MLKRFFALIKKDFILGSKDYFTLVVIISAILMGCLVRFVIPKEQSTQQTIYYYLETDQPIIQTTLVEKYGADQQVNSLEALKDKMNDNFNSIGLYLKLNEEEQSIEVIFQGHENVKQRKLMVSLLEGSFLMGLQENRQIKTTVLDPRQEDAIPFNEQFVPLFLVLESALIGLILIASLIFSEKEEGTLVAYRVGPGSLSAYLGSKVTFMLVLTLISATIITSISMGFKGNVFALIIVLILSSFVGSNIGLILSSFFDNISKAMLWLVLISMVIGMPIASYINPAFSPSWFKLFPTYYMIFGVKEAIFQTGNTVFLWQSIILLLVTAVLTFYVAVFAYKKRIRKV